MRRVTRALNRRMRGLPIVAMALGLLTAGAGCPSRQGRSTAGREPAPAASPVAAPRAGLPGEGAPGLEVADTGTAIHGPARRDPRVDPVAVVEHDTALLAGLAAPEWRDRVPGSAYLGPDVLWRPREWLVFHLQDEAGGGFHLDFTVRDMNVYHQGPRPVMVWIVGPGDRTLARVFLRDDGVVSGNDRHRDGVYDPYGDFRYRQWHRAHSPGGYPPGKERSPYLREPERLPARAFRVPVADAGDGLYRVVVVASWDHWISMTPSRPIATGIHPGPGPLYVHGDQMERSWFHVPAAAADIGLMLTEETEPYGGSMSLRDASGATVAQRSARTFATYMIHEAGATDAVYELVLSNPGPGVCLHSRGFPPVFCPDAATARLLCGGQEVDGRGRVTRHDHQRILDAWTDGLRPADLAVAAASDDGDLPGNADLGRGLPRLAEVAELLDRQDLDPSSPTYGRFADGAAVDQLARLAGLDHADNPYYGDGGLIRRLLLARIGDMRRLSAFYWYDSRDDAYQFALNEGSFFSTPQRSGWYGLGLDSRAALTLRHFVAEASTALPDTVLAAWKRSLSLWAGGRWMMHVGETTNQWTYNLLQLRQVWEVTGDPEVRALLGRHARAVVTPGLLGRLQPDPAAWDETGEATYSHDADMGLTPSGYLAEQFGFDCQYTVEQVHNMGALWEVVRDPALVDWWNAFYWLKTHVTLPKTGTHTVDTFSGTCSPTDFNSRTRYQTHKAGLHAEARDLVVFGDLWVPREGDGPPRRTWPALEDTAFVRSIDGKYHFVNTGQYYAIAYSGPRLPAWPCFSAAIVGAGAAELAGYGGPGYGGYGRGANKVGALSAVFVPGCGPVLLGQNHNVWDANTVWGRRSAPIAPAWQKGAVDPTLVCSGYSQPQADFDAASRTYHLREDLLYAPLAVTRTVRFGDDRIRVELELEATGELELEALYHALPIYADERHLQGYAAAAESGFAVHLPEPLLTDTRIPQPEQEAARLDHAPVRLRGVDVSSANGAGAALLLDGEYEVLPTTPQRYRAATAATGSLNLPLPTRLRAGQTHALRYVIYVHAGAVTAQRLAQVAGEEGLW